MFGNPLKGSVLLGGAACDIIGAGARGYTHVVDQQVYQDRYKSCLLPDGTVILTVADGHGSASCPYSDTGAWAACKAFIHTIEQLDRSCGGTDQLFDFLAREGRSVARSVVARWQWYIRRSFKARQLPVPQTDDGAKDYRAMYRSCGTTLLGMVLTADWYFAFQLGDGDITLVSGAGCEPILNAVKYLGTETDSLCSSHAWEKAVYCARRWKPGSEDLLLILSSDGFCNSHINDAEFHNSCRAYFDLLRQKGGVGQIRSYLPAWLSDTSREGCGDDITTLFAWIRPE